MRLNVKLNIHYDGPFHIIVWDSRQEWADYTAVSLVNVSKKVHTNCTLKKGFTGTENAKGNLGILTEEKKRFNNLYHS